MDLTEIAKQSVEQATKQRLANLLQASRDARQAPFSKVEDLSEYLEYSTTLLAGIYTDVGKQIKTQIDAVQKFHDATKELSSITTSSVERVASEVRRINEKMSEMSSQQKIMGEQVEENRFTLWKFGLTVV